MNVEKEPFRRYHEEKAADSFTIRLNEEERKQFDEAKQFIEQTKDSTAMKQLAHIGIANVLHDKKTNQVLDIVLNNKRKNKRLGIVDFD